MSARKLLLSLGLAASLGALAACDSSEERAEKYYRSGMEYLESGQTELALVEFRNVFKLNGKHLDARLTYARVERDRGNTREAYGQYLRVVEQYPDNIEARRALAEMASASQDWAEVERHVTAALEIQPGDAGFEALRIATQYARAIETRDTAAQGKAAADAATLSKAHPEIIVARRIIIDDMMRRQAYGEAGTAIAEALAIDPKDRTLYSMRLSIFGALGDNDAIEKQLQEMIGVFPEDPAMQVNLVRWYVSQGEIDKAEAAMRSAAAAKPDDPDAALGLVRFLSELRGPDAALAETDRLIAAGTAPVTFRAVHAGLLFDAGRRDEAIAEMEELAKTAGASDEGHNVKVGLARMKLVSGNPVAAQALIEEVLATDKAHVEALKLKAAWLTEDDKTDEAISLLRKALDEAPRDPDVLTLMAQAHERNGDRTLMGEMLALAVEASGKAPDESLRYATFLTIDGKLLPAETVLIDSLRLSPGEPRILQALGQIYLELDDWGRAGQVADTLEKIGTPEASSASFQLRAAALQGQEKTSETLSYLESLVTSGEAGMAAQLAIIRTHLARGEPDAARAYAAELLAADPTNPDLRFLDASVRALTGESELAEGVYRDLVRQDPSRLQAWLALYRLLGADGKGTQAEAVLAEAVAALPEAPELQWARAGVLERDGDIEGAIAIYEALYEKDSNAVLIANNLASLLSTGRSDAESLARAELVSRRLKGTKFAPFQDTYGWIAHLRGNSREALGYLEPAAAGLTSDAGVQYHLGVVYRALGREDEAMGQFRKVAEMTTADDPRPFVAEARAAAAAVPASSGEVPQSGN